MNFKEMYEEACYNLAKKISNSPDVTTFITEVSQAIFLNASKGYRIYGRDTAVDEVYTIAKSLGIEEGLVWSFLIRHFDKQSVEIQQTQFSVLFKLKDCV